MSIHRTCVLSLITECNYSGYLDLQQIRVCLSEKVIVFVFLMKM